MARFHLEVCDRMDLRRRASRWTGRDFDDREWLPARVLQRETGWPSPQANERATHLTPPWTVLSGPRERWDAFYQKPARWLAVVFRHLPGEARLFEAGLTRTEYPFTRKGS